ncbi:MAG: HPr family phosphocarrier protein [Lachnospiraceae bacterium]|nr:HPr family phosphocarrier protein [Lachnospiraceae bacterium]MBQ6856983.1 HPr family phosphocarrier protein [Lachnospiraceae bacterium]
MTKQKKIKLDTIQDAKKFVALANECDFDVNVRFNHFIIDAKSILGVLSLDLAKAFTVEYDGEERMFEDFMDTMSADRKVAVA